MDRPVIVDGNVVRAMLLQNIHHSIKPAIRRFTTGGRLLHPKVRWQFIFLGSFGGDTRGDRRDLRGNRRVTGRDNGWSRGDKRPRRRVR